MKRSIVMMCILAFFLATIFTGCLKSSPLQAAMNDYSKIVGGDLPEDIRITIYYIDPDILTRMPLSKDKLATFPGVKVITAKFEELASHQELLKGLNASILQPVQEESFVNARLYYVFEVDNSEKIMEVVISNIHGSAFINGIEVEDNPIFYELIAPFLTAEDRDILGI